MVTIYWRNIIDWEPERCPACKGESIFLRRVSIRTAQGTGEDSWLCERCRNTIVRIGVFHAT